MEGKMQEKKSEEEITYDPIEFSVPKLHKYIEQLHNMQLKQWIDFEKNPPENGQMCIGLHKFGMCFFEHTLPRVNSMQGLFYIPRNGCCSGLRYSVTEITHWQPLPVAYDS